MTEGRPGGGAGQVMSHGANLNENFAPTWITFGWKSTRGANSVIIKRHVHQPQHSCRARRETLLD